MTISSGSSEQLFLLYEAAMNILLQWNSNKSNKDVETANPIV